MTEAPQNHTRTVSIGGRNNTDIHFVADLNGLVEELKDLV